MSSATIDELETGALQAQQLLDRLRDRLRANEDFLKEQTRLHERQSDVLQQTHRQLTSLVDAAPLTMTDDGDAMGEELAMRAQGLSMVLSEQQDDLDTLAEVVAHSQSEVAALSELVPRVAGPRSPESARVRALAEEQGALAAEVAGTVGEVGRLTDLTEEFHSVLDEANFAVTPVKSHFSSPDPILVSTPTRHTSDQRDTPLRSYQQVAAYESVRTEEDLSLQVQLADSRVEKHALEQQLERTNGVVDTLRDELAVVRREFTASQALADRQTSKIAQLQRSITQLKEDSQMRLQEVVDARRQSQEVARERDEALASRTKFEIRIGKLKTEVSRLRSDNETLDSERNALESQVEGLRIDEARNIDQITSLEGDLQQTRRDLQVAEAKIQDLLDIQAEDRAKNARIQEQLSDLEHHHRELCEQAERDRSVRLELEQALRARETTLADVQTECDAMRDALLGMQDERDRFVQNVGVFEATEAELQVLRENLSTKSSALESRERQLNERERQLRELEHHVESLLLSAETLSTQPSAAQSHLPLSTSSATQRLAASSRAPTGGTLRVSDLSSAPVTRHTIADKVRRYSKEVHLSSPNSPLKSGLKQPSPLSGTRTILEMVQEGKRKILDQSRKRDIQQTILRHSAHIV